MGGEVEGCRRGTFSRVSIGEGHFFTPVVKKSSERRSGKRIKNDEIVKF